MEGKKKSPPPDRHPKTPKIKLPPGACDCHFHILGPQARFPLKPNRDMEFEDCTYDDLVAMQDALGLTRGLIVQSFQHGGSYEYMLHALSRDPNRWRGIAGPAPDITDRELEILTKAGVVGARYAYYVSPDLDVKTIQRLAAFGWQAHYMVNGEKAISGWREHILKSPGKFVLDHMANPPVKKGLDSMEFKFLLECLDTGRCWTKLSPRYSDEQTLPFADTVPFIKRVVERYPDRLLWGSDWPHPHYFKPMPNDGDLIDLMLDWVPDEAIRKRIFTDNPAELFGFPR
jgi:predicted TIM-barrel fold metal-dependent hydrolase